MDGIEFSDKYEPLFKLLSCWKELEKNPNDKYLQQLSKVDTVLISGGRDSGKTFGEKTFEVVAASDYEHRVLSTRFTMSSTDNSITKAIINRAENLNKSHLFNFQSKEIVCKNGKGRISITGQKTSSGDQTAKLKSLEDYSMFVTDEAEELPSYEEWNKVKRSIRAKDVQALSILVFNPPVKDHWINQRFYLNVPSGFCGIIGNILYIHTTYLDNGKNNMAGHIWREYEFLRKQYEKYESLNEKKKKVCDITLKRDWEDYKYRILGGFKNRAEGVVYENWKIGEFQEADITGYGLDFGSNDPDALTKCSIDFDNRRIYLKQEYFKSDTDSQELFDVLVDRCGYDNLIIGDTSGRRLIKQYYKHGLNIRRASKKDKLEQIKVLQSWDIIVDKDSSDLIVAFNNYAFHDQKAGIINHDYSDLMDSFRYFCWNFLKKE